MVGGGPFAFPTICPLYVLNNMKSNHLAGCLMAAFFMSAANAQTLRANWSPCDDCDGYRVYEYKNGEKLLLQESNQTSFETEISESIVLGVAAYNDVGESEVIPRLVVIEKPKPAIVKITVEVE